VEIEVLAAVAPVKQLTIPTGQEGGWAPKLVWTSWRRE